MKRWRRVAAVVLVGCGVIAVVLLAYLMFLKPVPGEELVPAGQARNTSSYVTMRDGNRLAAEVWLPADLQAGQRLPAILITTRYWRAHDMGPLYRLLVGVGEERVPNIEEADQWNDAGYALILVDARGSGASSGQRPVEWSDAEVADMGEIIEWITLQPWSSGNVGAVGVSYAGNTAELSTIPAHPALRAVAPLYSDFDPQFFLTMPGGVYNRGFVEAWNAANQARDANDTCKLQGVDGLGCWWLKLAVPGVKPVDADTNGSALRDAVAGHATLDLADALEDMPYRDDTLPDGVSIGDVSPYGRLDPFQPRWTFPNPTFDQQFADLVTFFDRHLKSPSDSVQTRSVRYYTMNEGRWRTTANWPPPEMESRRWYIGDDRSLTDSPPVAAGQDDSALNASASSGDTTRWLTQLGGGDVYYPDRAEEDVGLLTYTSAPLEAAIRITGTPELSLHLSSTHPDGALHVYLEDVAPDGRVTYLTEGILRLVHGASDTAVVPYEHPGPPRSYLRGDAEPLTPGELVHVEMPLYATSVRLEAGHRVRLAVAGQDASTFARYPADGAPVVTVVHSPAHPSLLELPVAPD